MNDIGWLYGNYWQTFLKAAFEISDCFSLRLVDWWGKPSGDYLGVFNDLEQWEIRAIQYDNAREPIKVFGEYEKKFYECNFFTWKIIMQCGDMKKYVPLKYPDDICFYRNNHMWFETISHEQWMFIDGSQTEILALLKEKGCDIV